ncbi:DUF3800 domain-containing protein [Propionibacterium australiense]|uniref:DUF3800 domain-containing protein n=1 Tax=Propionibacterium australiense TaxID=119981 RepID=A0A383S3F8_9ACTN|nr:DUF3800 domain-containing protein [Propionibacterium australiense]RLP11513.1 DUF3800 domain-containing protein [Propionibacterium australiense]SYZ32221.1 Protein of unknown function DUF3800 [Propionibacterium australiense]VEH90645.1 Protein of uncharacterised function (DUF3800) [Propionibacterium australiense]
MTTAYIDESYTAVVYFVGAAVAADVSWTAFTADLALLQTKVSAQFGLPSDVEFHAAQMFGGRGEWRPLRGRHREVGEIVSTILRHAEQHDIRYFVRGVDIPALKQRYSIPRHPHSVALEHVLQRLERHGAYLRLPPHAIRVVADEVDLSSELQSQFAGYQQYGTHSRYYDNRLEHLISPMDFHDSRTEFGLQLIDIVVLVPATSDGTQSASEGRSTSETPHAIR